MSSAISNDTLKNISRLIGIPKEKLEALPKDTLEKSVIGFEHARHAKEIAFDANTSTVKAAKVSLTVTNFYTATIGVTITGFADSTPTPAGIDGTGSVGSRPDIEGDLVFKQGVTEDDFLSKTNKADVDVSAEGIAVVLFYQNSGSGITPDNYLGKFSATDLKGTGSFTGSASVTWNRTGGPKPVGPKAGTATVNITGYSDATITIDVTGFAKTVPAPAKVNGTGSNGTRTVSGNLTIVSGKTESDFISKANAAEVTLSATGVLTVKVYENQGSGITAANILGTFSGTDLHGTGNFTGSASQLTWTSSEFIVNVSLSVD
ncbi:hypothetical protein CONPUDRAFT_167748 [Coniophora puteana RWD-64-598 SS2]|uniref:Uncharacterized protein n=1 Tax=Coniophora puteana (strain RWD-64-598) TaxID=741705 RepID=A0A5M3MFC7_CONPW|nr:uncharacterized protein CONPUDRAFT_167748 [Coniophora puteana RWD-64-598 SS2]EIW77630.1 hypothetical protein CONPUDRAFT_167748 [Coniophora puteana RWD-64-598 SS2]